MFAVTGFVLRLALAAALWHAPPPSPGEGTNKNFTLETAGGNIVRGFVFVSKPLLDPDTRQPILFLNFIVDCKEWGGFQTFGKAYVDPESTDEVVKTGGHGRARVTIRFAPEGNRIWGDVSTPHHITATLIDYRE